MTGVRVGVDATSWGNRRGFGRFARNCVGRLVESDPETTYVMYVDQASASQLKLPERAEHRPVRLSRPPAEAAAADSSRSPADLLRLTQAVRRDALDAFVFPSVYTYFPVVAIPTVVGLHDAITRRLPELTVPTRRARAFTWAKESLAVRRASRLFTVSEASRAALAEHLGINRELLAIVSEAPDPVFFPRDAGAVAAALTALGLAAERGLFLFAGGISPHKNVETLLDAYALVRRERDDVPPLVLVGELDSDPYLSSTARVRARITRLGLEEDVLLPGFVSDETLACLYSAASAVALPSLAEGFGLPAVEAAACGAPIVLSDLAAHRETLDGAALFFPATDAAELASHLARLLAAPGLGDRLGELARETVAPLSWDASAEQLRRIVAAAGQREGAATTRSRQAA